MHIPFLPAGFLRKQIRVCAHSCCANTYIPLLAGPLREQLPTQENSWTHVHALCTLAHALPPHSQPLRKLHLKESTESGGCLPAASASSPSSSPGAPSAPCEDGGATDWLICPVSSGTCPCPWLPRRSVSPSGAGTVVLSPPSSRGSDRSHTRSYLQKQWVPEMKPAPEDLGVCWGSCWHSWGTVGRGCKSGFPILATVGPWPCLPETGVVVVVIAGVHCVLPV